MTRKTGMTFRESKIETDEGTVRVFGPVAPEEIEDLDMDDTLKCFRRPEQQKKSLAEIAALTKGQVFTAVHGNTIIGYVTFHPPDVFERWSHGGIASILELGAIEVSRHARRLGLAKELMQVAFRDGAMEDYIVIATEYYWHWDLEGSGLAVWDYRRMMESIMSSVGLRPRATNDPEINSHPVNMLVVRIGENVSVEDAHKFDKLCLEFDDNDLPWFDF